MTATEIGELRDQLAAATRLLHDAWAETVTDLDGAAAHLTGQHHVPVFPAEAACAAALKSMHVAAHQRDAQQAADDLDFALADDAGPDPVSDAWATSGPHQEDEDPAYLAWIEQQLALCGADFLTGPLHDPYGTNCDHGAGHYPHTDHGGPDPFGNGGRVSWRGGGTCAGDPLPQTDVRYVQPEGGDRS